MEREQAKAEARDNFKYQMEAPKGMHIIQNTNDDNYNIEHI